MKALKCSSEDPAGSKRVKVGLHGTWVFGLGYGGLESLDFLFKHCCHAGAMGLESGGLLDDELGILAVVVNSGS